MYSTVGTVLTSLSRSGLGGRRLAASATADAASALLEQLGQFESHGSRAAGGGTLPSTQYVDQLAAFLAEDATGAALADQLATDAALQALKPKTSAKAACAEKKKGQWSAKVSISRKHAPIRDHGGRVDVNITAELRSPRAGRRLLLRIAALDAL
jgi:pectin methylesterase-like acyl-CoA thioesterase